MPGLHRSRKPIAALLGLSLLACGSSQGAAKNPAQKSQFEFADPTADEQRSLDAFTKLGWAIYQQDVAAAKATDAVLAITQGKLDPRVRGWAVVETNSGHRVQFMAPSDTRLLVPYEVEVPLAGDPKARRSIRPPRPRTRRRSDSEPAKR